MYIAIRGKQNICLEVARYDNQYLITIYMKPNGAISISNTVLCRNI